jgi:hypothetical protein
VFRLVFGAIQKKLLLVTSMRLELEAINLSVYDES